MVWDALRQRCPRCGQGAVYRGVVAMHERCPVCGLQFEREPGYFTGAMYVSYAIGILIALPLWMGMLLAGFGVVPIVAAVAAELALAFPLMFRYSRVVWMHLDFAFNPVE